MSSNFEDKPFSESDLDSPEYRQRLMRKLNTLIAVLEVACAKVRQSLAGQEPDIQRLTRIHKNLQDTLKVCKRAKLALDRSEKLPANLPEDLTELTKREHLQAQKRKRKAVPILEMSSPEEAEKFAKLSPIEAKEIREVDLDDLCDKLASGD